MAIIIRGYHRSLPPKMAKELDAIAMPIQLNYEWEFEGSIGDFSEQWKKPFLAYPKDRIVFVTQHNSFGAR